MSTGRLSPGVRLLDTCWLLAPNQTPHAGADDCADSAAHSPPAAAAIGPPEAETVVVASAGAPCGEANDAGAGVDAGETCLLRTFSPLVEIPADADDRPGNGGLATKRRNLSCGSSRASAALAEHFAAKWREGGNDGDLAMSQWHPPPHHRRLAGDIAYLAVTTLEGESVQVTAHVDGFFVNKSTAQLFDPSPRSPLKSTCKAHNIADLLTKISPRFGAQYKLLQETYSKYIISEIFSPQSTSLAIPWLARPPKHTEDSLRAADSYLKFGPEALEAFRDWNDEIQAHRELPRETVHDRLFRERGLIRIYADFAESAGRGAQMVVMGDVQPVNPLDRNDGHMYINGGIFFSRGFDGHEAFQKIGGDAASHVATGKDIEGVRILNNLDIDGLYTLGSAVVDYKGERLVAQTIVPGILRGANVKEKVVYGSFDAETKLAADPTFHEIFGRVAEQLHLAEHEVDAGGNDGSRVELFLSKEAKGLFGGDGRRYALDLYRTCPVDVEWLESECLRKNAGEGHKGDEEVLPPYPHQLVLLRPELVEAFWMYRLRCWTRDQAAAIAEKLAEGNICNGGSQVAAPQQKATVQLAPNEIVSEAADKNFNAKQQDEVAEKERKYEMPDAVVSNFTAAKIGQFKLALNPDVLTDAYPASWERDETLKKQEEDVRACSKFLHDVIIPAFVNEAISDSNIHFDSRALTEQMHKFGINMRCLGRIALMLAKEDDPKAVLLKFVHAGGCVAHFLNCFLGEQLNAQPRPALSLDEELAEWEDHAADKRSTKRDYRLLTPLGLRRAIQQDIAERYRYRLPDNVFDMDGGVGGFNRL
ncbi:MAG: clustered mitochondria-domain-containing protein, partial [Olpidium bornovanus]